MVEAHLFGFGGALWLALFIATRTPQRSLLFWASITSLFGLMGFFGSGVLGGEGLNLEQLVNLERGFWWSSVLPITAWLMVCSLIHQTLQPSIANIAQPERWVVGVLGLILIGLGSFSNVLLNYAEPVLLASGRQIIGIGPAYPIYSAYVMGCVSAAIWHLVASWRIAETSMARRSLASLVLGALGFLIGTSSLLARLISTGTWPIFYGYVPIFAGLLITGFGLVRFGLLLQGQNVLRDLIYSFCEISILALIYLISVNILDLLRPSQLALLLACVIISHTGLDRGRRWLDRLFFSRAEQEARSQSREFAIALASTPTPNPAPLIVDAKPDKVWNDAVRRAISGLKNPVQLAQNPLLSSSLVSTIVQSKALEDNRLNRSAITRELLLQAIEQLRPDASQALGSGDAWRWYNVLYLPYVREINRKTAIDWLRRGLSDPLVDASVLSWLADIDEDTFYKWQRRASDLIAAQLWEQQLKLVQAIVE